MSISVTGLASLAIAANAAASTKNLINATVIKISREDSDAVQRHYVDAEKARGQLALTPALTLADCAAKASVLLDWSSDGMSMDDALALSLARDVVALAG